MNNALLAVIACSLVGVAVALLTQLCRVCRAQSAGEVSVLVWPVTDIGPATTQVRDLLSLIAGTKCAKVWGGSRCWEDSTLTPNCEWSADRWCDACIAQVALDALNSSPLVTAPGGEVASPVTDYVTAHVVAGDASNVPTPNVGDGPPE